MSPYEVDIRQWILHISQPREKLGGFAVCPFAATAKFHIEKRDLSDVGPCEGSQVTIFVVEDTLSLSDMVTKCAELNEKYDDYIFLDDHKDEDSFINGVQTNNGKYNLVIVQEKTELIRARRILHKTEYYTYWSEEFYNRIVEG